MYLRAISTAYEIVYGIPTEFIEAASSLGSVVTRNMNTDGITVKYFMNTFNS